MTIGTVLLPLVLAAVSLAPPVDEAAPARSAAPARDAQTEARDRLRGLLRDCRLARTGVEFEVRLRRTSAPELEWGRARVTRLPGALLVAERATELSADSVDFVRIDGLCGKRFSFDGGVEIGAAQSGSGSALESWLPLALQDGSMLEAPDEVRSLEESLEQWAVHLDGAGDGRSSDLAVHRKLAALHRSDEPEKKRRSRPNKA